MRSGPWWPRVGRARMSTSSCSRSGCGPLSYRRPKIRRVADEHVDEAAGRARLVELKLASEAARIEAQQGTYSAERWRPWLEAASAFGDAVTEHGLNRFDLEKAVTTAALHPPTDEA